MSLQDIYKKAGVVMKPAAIKDGKLYSQQPHSGAGDFNFSRADGVQTRINKHGLIETVANNEPRLSYDIVDGKVSDCPHLLLEPSRTNDMQRSEEFDNSYWTKYDTSVSENQVVSPDGSVTADKLTEDTGTSSHMIGRSFSFTSGTTYAVSVFVKENGRDLEIAAGNPNTWQGSAIYDLSTGSVKSENLGTASIENFGNGWYRCVLVGEAIATSSTNILFKLVDDTSTSYTGDGSSGVYFWGAQREVASYPTSYIPTSGSTETRQADICNGSGNSETFNDSEGVLFLELAALSNDLSERRVSVSNSTTGNVVRVGFTSVSNRILGVVYNGSNQAILTTQSYTIVDYHKVALKYKENDFALWVDGTEVATDSSGTTFASGLLGELAFDDGNGGSDFYGKVKQLAVINEALTDEQLQLLTTP